jgi:glycosyltransferase involved in cell wall biosynthesis
MDTKITVLYDPQMFDIQDYGGISRYFANLISGVNTQSNFKAIVPVVYSSNYYLREMPQLFNNLLGRKLLKSRRKRRKWNRKYAIQQIKKSNFDLLHATYYDPYVLENLRKPMVITIHDMIYENYPELFPEAAQVIAQKKIMIESASRIITISEYTKRQLFKHYPTLNVPVDVIYHGLPISNIESTHEALPKPYLLYVGDRFAAYKNFDLFIEAIAPILRAGEYSLVCAGGGSFNTKEETLFKSLGLLESVKQMNVSDALLKQLYQQAAVFIYPSLEEGFGLPLLEAFINGCPVACGDSSCFPEVGGLAVSYFNPLDKSSMHSSISLLLGNPGIRMEQVKAGFEQVAKFTYQESLDLTLKVYHQSI